MEVSHLFKIGAGLMLVIVALFWLNLLNHLTVIFLLSCAPLAGAAFWAPALISKFSVRLWIAKFFIYIYAVAVFMSMLLLGMYSIIWLLLRSSFISDSSMLDSAFAASCVLLFISGILVEYWFRKRTEESICEAAPADDPAFTL